MTRRIHAKAVIFDLDGVLADSTFAVDRSWEAWAQQHSVDPKRAIAIGHGRTTIEAIRIIAPQLDASESFAEMERFEASFIDEVKPVNGAPQFVARVIDLNVPWAVVTSGTRRIAVPRLKRSQIPDPPVLVTADDTTHGKPHPEPYEKAAAALGIEPWYSVVFEDSPAGMFSARRAGAHVIGIGSDARDFVDVEIHTTHSSNLSACVSVVPSRYRCTCCECHTLLARHRGEICALCKWEDDGDESGEYDLAEARDNVQLHGVMYRPTDVRFAPVRHPILGPSGEYAIDRVALRGRAYREFHAFAGKADRAHLPERLHVLLAAVLDADRLYRKATL